MDDQLVATWIDRVRVGARVRVEILQKVGARRLIYLEQTLKEAELVWSSLVNWSVQVVSSSLLDDFKQLRDVGENLGIVARLGLEFLCQLLLLNGQMVLIVRIRSVVVVVVNEMADDLSEELSREIAALFVLIGVHVRLQKLNVDARLETGVLKRLEL